MMKNQFAVRTFRFSDFDLMRLDTLISARRRVLASIDPNVKVTRTSMLRDLIAAAYQDVRNEEAKVEEELARSRKKMLKGKGAKAAAKG